MMFEVEYEGQRRTIPRMVTSLDLTEEPPRQIGEELFQETYILKTEVYVRFFSNKAQLSQKVKQAERTMRSYLFKDMLPIVEELLLEVSSKEAFEMVTELKRKMTEVEK